jgi:multidrug efflux pump subunit AcrA (membrane-fusion protein)
MRRNRWIGLAVLAVVATFSGCGKREEKSPAPPPPVVQPLSVLVTNTMQPAKPTESEVPLLAETVAELRGSGETPVVAASAGYLVKQVHQGNAIVDTGDALFMIDPRSLHPDPIIPGKNDLGIVAVIAPAHGAVSRALHGVGDWINAHDELATIAKVDPIRAVFFVPEGTVLARQDFALTLEDGSVYPSKGKLGSVTADDTKITVLIDFPNPTYTLRPGQFARVSGVAP